MNYLKGIIILCFICITNCNTNAFGNDVRLDSLNLFEKQKELLEKEHRVVTDTYTASKELYEKTDSLFNNLCWIISIGLTLMTFLVGGNWVYSYVSRKNYFAELDEKFKQELSSKLEELINTNEKKLTIKSRELEDNIKSELSTISKELQEKNIRQLISELQEFNRTKEDVIKNLISRFETEEIIRNERKVLVIAHTSETIENDIPFYLALSVFKGFDNSSIYSIEDFTEQNTNALVQKVRGENYSAIIIKNNLGHFISEFNEKLTGGYYHNNLIKLINNSPQETAILYYGVSLSRAAQGIGIDGFIELNQPQIDQEQLQFLSFVNAPGQIYGNLMNLLKYREEVLQIKNK